MSSVRRRLTATSFAAAALLVLGACGFNAQTNHQYQAAVGAHARGEMDVLNTLLVANDDGSATVSASLVNHTESEQSLSSVSVTAMDGTELAVRGLKLLLPLPQNRLAGLGLSSDAGGFRVTEGAKPGYFVKVTFSFTASAPVTVEAPVVERTAEYEKVAGAEPLPTDAAAVEAEALDQAGS